MFIEIFHEGKDRLVIDAYLEGMCFQGLQLLVESIQRRDYPVVQGAVLLIALCYIAVNTMVDTLYTRLDPRIGTPA